MIRCVKRDWGGAVDFISVTKANGTTANACPVRCSQWPQSVTDVGAGYTVRIEDEPALNILPALVAACQAFWFEPAADFILGLDFILGIIRDSTPKVPGLLAKCFSCLARIHRTSLQLKFSAQVVIDLPLHTSHISRTDSSVESLAHHRGELPSPVRSVRSPGLAERPGPSW